MNQLDDILVVGGSGFIGSALVEALTRSGMHPRVLARHPEEARRTLPPGTRVIPGDLLEFSTLPPALRGVRTVYYLVHSMGGSGPGGGFELRDRTAAEHLVHAASDAGVSRILYVGGLGDETSASSRHLESRREVGRILGSGDPKLTTLRAAVVVGAGGSSFEMVVQLVERLPVLLCPSWIRTRCQPIDLRDLVSYLVGCLAEKATVDRSFDVGGPEIVPYYELLNRVGLRMGRLSRIVVLPLLTPSLSAHWVGLITDVPSSVARDLVEGMRAEVVCRETSIRSIVPIPLHRLDDSLDHALAVRPLRPLALRQFGASVFGTPTPRHSVLDFSRFGRAAGGVPTGVGK